MRAIGAPALDGQFDIVAAKAGTQAGLQRRLQLPERRQPGLLVGRGQHARHQTGLTDVIEAKNLGAAGAFEMAVLVLLQY